MWYRRNSRDVLVLAFRTVAFCRGSSRQNNVASTVLDGEEQLGEYAQPRETLPKRASEALLVDECACGRLARGKVAELLSLSFHEIEEMFRAHRLTYPIKTSDDDDIDNASLPKSR